MNICLLLVLRSRDVLAEATGGCAGEGGERCRGDDCEEEGVGGTGHLGDVAGLGGRVLVRARAEMYSLLRKYFCR